MEKRRVRSAVTVSLVGAVLLLSGCQNLFNDGGNGGQDTTAVTGVSLDQSEVAFQLIGETVTLTATIAPGNVTNNTVIWSSSDAAVADVDANGTVTAVNSGSATITAATEDGSYAALATVSVPYPIVDAGSYYTMAWLADGTLWTWG
jgi:uncharacterized protein YjdB